VLIDSIAGTDTARSTYTASSFTDCSFSIVPSIISKPIMSANMVRAWADSAAVIVRDTLDTCVVKVPHNADTVLYWIDMSRGVIIELYWGPSEDITHQYFYGYDKGIYYLQKVSCSSPGFDTSISSGGYLFSNIRINGEPVTSVADRLRPEKSPFAIHPIGRGRDRIVFTGGEAGMRITAFDMFGRSLFETALQGKGDALRLDRLCGGARCPSGPLVLRRIGPDGAASFSTVIVR
jgi:hypothetical protein